MKRNIWNQGKVTVRGMRKSLCTCNQWQLGGDDVAAAAEEAQADGDAALLGWCMRPRSSPLASFFLDPSVQWR